MGVYRQDIIKPSEITDQSVWRQRRNIIKAAAALGLGAGLGSLSSTASPLYPGPDRNKAMTGVQKTGYGSGLQPTAYKHVTSYNNFYEFGTGKDEPAHLAKDFKPSPWQLEVTGECHKPGSIDMQDILASISQEERVYRFRCVEAWYMVVPWVGFPLAELLKRFQPTGNAKYVAFETLHDPDRMPGQKRQVLDWPYREGLRMDEAMHPLTILATGLYGELLPNQNGAPLRLVVPWKYGFKSIKSIVAIRFTEHMPVATWQAQNPAEYGFYANVNPAVSHPRWSQKRHRVLGESLFADKQDTQLFNGYQDEVAGLYSGMDLRKYF